MDAADTAALLKRIEELERENKELNALVKNTSSTQHSPTSCSASGKLKASAAPAAASAAAVASEGASTTSASASAAAACASPSDSDSPTAAASPPARRLSWSELSLDPKERMINESTMLDITQGCWCSFADSQFYSGRLIVTDLMVSFLTYERTPYPPHYLVVDLGVIEQLKFEKKSKGGSDRADGQQLGEFPISIVCKDGRNLAIRFANQKEHKAMLQLLEMICFKQEYPRKLFGYEDKKEYTKELDLTGYRFNLLKAWNRLMSSEILADTGPGVNEITVGAQTFFVGCYYTGQKPESKAGVQLRRVPGNSDSYFKPARILANGQQCIIISLEKGQEGTWFAWVQALPNEPDVTAVPDEPPADNDHGGYVPLEELQPFWDRSSQCATQATSLKTTYYAGTAYEIARPDRKNRTKLRCCAAVVKTKKSVFSPSRVVVDGTIVVPKFFRVSPVDGVWFAWIVPLDVDRRNKGKREKKEKGVSGFIRVDSLYTSAASSAIAPDKHTVAEAASTDAIPDDLEQQADTAGTSPAPAPASAAPKATSARKRSRFHSEFPNWAIVDNSDFKLVPTYPEYFVVPSFLRQHGLAEVIAFRSKGRVPALVWLDTTSGAAMLRCSQPKMGAAGVKRCASDERLYEVLKQRQDLANARTGRSGKTEKVLIVDCRPQLNALANRASGKGGYEKAEHYPNTELEYLKIGNIHVMRKSCNRLKEICATSSSQEDDLYWHRSVDSTDWLAHLRRILLGAGYVAHSMRFRGKTVIVHCSDGWDRTPQITSLTQILLDPDCRTLEGFCDLIEKDWLAFGHQFARRLGHGSADYKDDQRCPVFIQFLDCVWQLLNAFPAAFGFNEAALICIADASFSQRFGTFHCDNQMQRERHGVFKNSSSLWKYMFHPERRDRFTPDHPAAPRQWGQPQTADRIPLGHMPLLTADYNLFRLMIVREVTVWRNYWMRYAAVPCMAQVYTTFLDRSKALEPSRRSQRLPPPTPIRNDAATVKTVKEKDFDKIVVNFGL